MTGTGFTRIGSVATVALLVVSGLLAVSAATAPRAGATVLTPPPPTSWAYGVDRWFNLTLTPTNGLHTIAAHFSWYTVFNRTAVSANVTELRVERWVLSNFTSTYCSPDCVSPDLEVVLHHATFEHAVGALNLTRNGIVYVNGTSVPAFAVLNSSARLDGSAASTASVTVVTNAGVRYTNSSFRATGAANATLAFDPALGLLPTVLTAGLAWNSTSDYAGTAAWAFSWNYTKTNASGQTSTASGDPSGSLSATGSISLDGYVLGAMALPNGSVLPTVVLELNGSFELLDGTILLPRLGGVFNDGAQAWNRYQMGFSWMEQHGLAVQFGGAGTGFQLRAASAFYGTNDSTMAMGSDGMRPPGPGAAGTYGPGGGIPSTEVVANPIAPGSAWSAGTCLAGGSCGVPNPSAFPWVLTLAISGVAAAAVAIVATARLRNRGRLSP